MKKLSKLFLLNWFYYSVQLVEFEDINFLTGKNSAGKSTLIDALEIVLLGEASSKNFNKAADEKSQRTLEGYLRTDLQREHPRSRIGKEFNSYIVCECYDDVKDSRFVQGVVFSCGQDGTHRHDFFTFRGAFAESVFVTENRPRTKTELRQELKLRFGTGYRIYDADKNYREDILAMWNVHNAQVFSLLKKAVSFRPIQDIQKFITENICDLPDHPDIASMQQNIRDYQRQLDMAKKQEEKERRLEEIGKSFEESTSYDDREAIQEYLIKRANQFAEGQALSALRNEKEQAQARIAELESSREQLVDIEDRLRAEYLCLQNDKATSDEGRQRQRLVEEAKRLEERIREDRQHLERTASNIAQEVLILQGFDAWLHHTVSYDWLAGARHNSQMALAVLAPFEKFALQSFAMPQTAFTSLLAPLADYRSACQKAYHTLEANLERARLDLQEADATLKKLGAGIKDYPAALVNLKSHLEEELGEEVPILADVIEVPDRLWQGAVEGYLGRRKFYLLVDPERYRDAQRLFHAYKKVKGTKGYGLVDIKKLRERERSGHRPDSLAAQVNTENELARSYVDYLLGGVVCCNRVEELRSHQVALTAEGMLYQGYVLRALSREQMDDAYVGKRAVELRKAALEEEREERQREIEGYLSCESPLKRQAEYGFVLSERYLALGASEDIERYGRYCENGKRVRAIDEEMGRMDFSYLEKLDARIAEVEEEQSDNRKAQDEIIADQGELRGRVRTIEEKELPEGQKRFDELTGELESLFDDDYRSQTGEPRFLSELAKEPDPLEIAKRFGPALGQTRTAQQRARESLLQLREGYIHEFQPCSFNPSARDNKEFDDYLSQLQNSDLPKYRAKIKEAHASAIEQFRNDFLSKLKSNIEKIQSTVQTLNKALKQMEFGDDSYRFLVERNPDYAEYYDMIMDPLLMDNEDGLFATAFMDRYGELVESLFNMIVVSDDEALNARRQSELARNIARFTDFRTYLRFDLETTDREGKKQLLSRELSKKSGGEVQTPFYIAVLASFSQLYHVNDPTAVGNTMRLVVFDEAFSKMDTERIVKSIHLLRHMGLQAIICTPPDKIPDISPEVDRTLLVLKDSYRMQIYTSRKSHSEPIEAAATEDGMH